MEAGGSPSRPSASRRSPFPRQGYHGSANPTWSWQTRRCQDLVILCATVVLVSISLYHACSMREVSHQTVRAKLLSRSYVNTPTDASNLRVKGSGAVSDRASSLTKDRAALEVTSEVEKSGANAKTGPGGRALGMSAVGREGAATTAGLAQRAQHQVQQQQEARQQQQQQQAVRLQQQQTGEVVDAALPGQGGQQQQQQATKISQSVTSTAEGSGLAQQKKGLQSSGGSSVSDTAGATAGQKLNQASSATSTNTNGVNTGAQSGSDASGAEDASGSASSGVFSGPKSFSFSQPATSAKPDVPTGIPGLPTDFDWKVYLLYHPDLAARGITTKEEAIDHWFNYGQFEGRIYSRLSVLVRYSACGGLTNQLYSHIAALSLAATLGAEAVLPPALTRSSFGHYFSMFKELNQVSWSAVPLESLFDVESLVDHWRGQGLILHKTPPLVSFPDMAAAEVAYMKYDMPGINEAFVVQMSDVYQSRMHLSQLVERARAAVVGHAQTLKRLDPTLDVKYIVLDLPCTFFMLSHLSELEIAREGAHSLRFAPAMVALADKVTDGIARDGSDSNSADPQAQQFNGIHLRLESDSRDWSAILGGRDAFWDAYVKGIQQAGFNSRTKLYAATGLLSYGAEDEMSNTLRTLIESGWASSVVYKELYLAREELEGLSSEQKALIDFIVLTRARTVVGLGSSTFSYYLKEYRAINGYRKADTVLADASRIGTDGMFFECGTISQE